MPATVKFTIQMNCGVRPDDDTGLFVSYCPTLDIYSQGGSEDEAIEAIKSAVALRLSTALGHGRLEKLLRKAGFKIAPHLPSDTHPASDAEFVHVQTVPNEFKAIPVEVPLTLLAANAGFSDACTH
jgi:predicted RNase H-like HicB family nuclease